ncbi:MAG: phytanoyl-CoA dioxygenase family protein [Flavobacterium sp.]
MDLNYSKKKIVEQGYTTISNVYTADEVEKILFTIKNNLTNNDNYRISNELFAIRQFLKEIPSSFECIFNQNLKKIIQNICGSDYFLIKSIYFDKPESSNWYVSYHQDLTISVDQKLNIPNYGPWTVKKNQFSVQPPIEILENLYTIRIHLDETNEQNGALKIIPKSHLKKIYRPETINWNIEKEEIGMVEKGGIMIMKPLLLHSSSRTINQKRRRVIHLEFSNRELSKEIQWSERINLESIF